MKVLLVTPTQSGETVTAIHVAENLIGKGHHVAFMASPDACSMISQRLSGNVFELTGSLQGNVDIWYRVLKDFTPNIVVFADYHIVASPRLSSPLGPRWITHLQRSQVRLVTFDHLGFGQCGEELTIGARHLHPQHVTFPVVPDEMRIMLPCPMLDPGSTEKWRGDPFRYWDLPLQLPENLRCETRRRFLKDDDELLIMHSVPTWAWKAAEALRLPFYHFLPEIFAYYFEDIGKSVTLVSVNNGNLLRRSPNGSFRIVNLPMMEFTDFENLLFSADLVLTENRVSISMAKAICAFQPSAVLKNSFGLSELSDRIHSRPRECAQAMERERSGAVFPFEVFPVDMTVELDKLGVYRNNALAAAFTELEIFGGEETKLQFTRLLLDRDMQNALCARQRLYVEKLRGIDDATEVLERYVGA